MEGVDFIELDIMVIKDGKLICFYDLVLDYVIDVVSCVEFVDCCWIYEVEGEIVIGYFLGDLYWEIRVINKYMYLWFCCLEYVVIFVKIIIY